MSFRVESVDEAARTITVVHRRGHRLTFAFPVDGPNPRLVGSPHWRSDDLWCDRLVTAEATVEAQRRGWT